MRQRICHNNNNINNNNVIIITIMQKRGQLRTKCMRSNVQCDQKLRGTWTCGIIVVAVAYASCERILTIARVLYKDEKGSKTQEKRNMLQIIKRVSRVDPDNTRLSVILHR